IQGRHGKEQGEKSSELVTVSDTGSISVEQIPTSVVPWVQVNVSASGFETADEVYDQVRMELQTQFPESNERVSALRVRIAGASDAHAELSRDPEQVRNEVISIANECGNGLLWVERVELATLPRLDRESLLQRDDPVGEIVRIMAKLREEPSALTAWEAITDLARKLPTEAAEGAEPIAMDEATLRGAIEQAEELLLSRLSAVEVE